jgi:asparagine synthase (glutamine-hydrolysing)
MCGIAGLVGRWEREALGPLHALLRHRGPDDAGEYHDEAAGVRLAMRRLSIVDIAGGHQPMSNADGSLWVVFNGEIFNAPEIRRDLEARGRVFRTSHSDTECLLQLYEERGEEMVGELNGMFAFVIYDIRRACLFGARDRFGIKPLYYAQVPEGFAFASEAKALLTLASVSRDVDPTSLSHYLSLRYVPGERSIFRSLRRVPPARSFRFDLASRTLTIERYWRPAFGRGGEHSPEEWAEIIRLELRAAAKRWTMADVPIGCSLSGGLDSTTIVGLLAESGYSRIRTYSLGFSGSDERPLSELSLARRFADRWGTQHQELILSADDLHRDLVRMVWQLDEPYGGGLPSWYVFEFMSRDVKVGLTGTGGDELFGGYGKWRAYEQSRRHGPIAIWQAMRAWAGGYRASVGWGRRFASPVEAYPLYLTDAAKRRLLVPESAASTAEELGSIWAGADTTNARDGVAAIDLETQLAEEFLSMTDRFSMAHSLEARVPFLDARFVDVALSIPATTRTAPHDLKYLLRQAAGDLLPDELRRAPKRGFVLPEALWLRGRLRPLAERLLAPDRLAKQGLLRPETYATLVRPQLDGRTDRAGLVWALLMFQLWHWVFIERNVGAQPDYTVGDILG